MKKMTLCLFLAAALCAAALTGCASKSAAASSAAQTSGSASAIVAAASTSKSSSAASSAAASKSSSSQAASSSASQAAASQSASGSAASSAKATYSEQDLADALDACLNTDAGSAGSSLKAASAAAKLVEFSAKNMLGDNVTPIGDAIQKWYDGLDATKRSALKDAWSEIYQDAQDLVADPAKMKDQLSDAGVTTDFTAMDLTTGISAANCIDSALKG
jgi:hypothetical protein